MRRDHDPFLHSSRRPGGRLRAPVGFALALAAIGCAGPPGARRTPREPVPLDHARHGHDLAALPDGTFLVVGGFSGADGAVERGSRETWALPPGADAWERRADLSWNHAFAGTVLVDGAAHAVGDGVLRYDAAADRWVEVVPRGSLPRSHFACAAVGDDVLVLGGFPAELAGPWRVDVAPGRVRRLAPPPGFAPGDHLHVAAVLDGAVHVVGGLDGKTFEPTARHVVLAGGRWLEQPEPPVGLWAKFAAVATHGKRLWCFSEAGGFRYDAGDGEWTRCRGLEDVIDGKLLAMPATWTDGESVWVLGGLGGEERRPRLLRYDVESDRWLDVTER